jgi:hypothetical protein
MPPTLSHLPGGFGEGHIGRVGWANVSTRNLSATETRAWRGKWLGSTSPYHVHHAAKKQETTTEGPSPAWQAMSSLGYPVPPTPLPRSSAAHQTVVPTCTRPDLARWADRPPGPHYVVVKHRSPARDPRYYRSLLFRDYITKEF